MYLIINIPILRKNQDEVAYEQEIELFDAQL